MTVKAKKLPRFVPHSATIVENESTGRRLADISKVCRLANGAQDLLAAAKLALAELVHEGIPHGKAGLALKAAIARVEAPPPEKKGAKP